MAKQKVNIAVIGAGYWGKNLVRNFAAADGANLKWVCDLDEKVLRKQKANFPFIQTTANIADVLEDKSVDAVVIATQAQTHFEIAKAAIEARKHTYVEKPLTLVAKESAKLVELAQKYNVKLMTGHLLIYHPAVRYLKELIDSGRIGDVYYMYTQRVNLGIVRSSENAWFSLAPHDISVVCYLLGSEPVSVAAQGQCHLQQGIEDVVFATVKFADGKAAHIHCSWLDPHKIRKMTVVGSEKMVTFDDMEATEKIRLYDKSAYKGPDYNTYSDIISLRFGDIVIPRIGGGEPLGFECRHFIECILEDKPVQTTGSDGLRVVRILQAGQASLENNGAAVSVDDF